MSVPERLDGAKTCTKCKVAQSAHDFSPDSAWCKRCRREYRAVRKARLEALQRRWLKPERAKPNEDETAMLPDDWEKFYRCVDDRHLLLLFDFLQATGLRIREALPLTPRDFSFERGVVRVRTLKQRYERGVIHTLHVRPDIVERLKVLGCGPDDRLFPFAYETVRLAFKRVLVKAGLNERLSLHSLRHLCGYRAAKASNGNEYLTARILRHAMQRDRSPTKRYMHATPADIREVMEKMWNAQPRLW